MAEQSVFTYKGKPMVRRGDVIYYGDLKEKYIMYIIYVLLTQTELLWVLLSQLLKQIL